MFSASGPPATCRGEVRFANRPRPSVCGASASQTAMSKTLVENVVSAGRKQKSTAGFAGGSSFTGFAAITCSCVRGELSVAFGALAFRLLSHTSMVRSEGSVTAATCAAVPGRSPVP